MGNVNRRQFLGSTSVSTLALWQGGPLLAVPSAREPRDPILDHVTREAARIQKDIQARGLRAEHLRAFKSNLRLATIQGRQQGIDAKIRAAARKANRNRTDALNRLEGATTSEHEKHQLEEHFPDLKGLDLDLNKHARSGRAGYAKALDVVSTNGGFTDVQNQLMQLTNGLSAELEPLLAANEGVLYAKRARIVRIQHGSCELRRGALEIVEMLKDAVCFLSVFEPALAPICIVLFIEVQVARLLLLIACGG